MEYRTASTRALFRIIIFHLSFIHTMEHVQCFLFKSVQQHSVKVKRLVTEPIYCQVPRLL